MSAPHDSPPKPSPPLLFDAVLAPHRSLSVSGFAILMTLIIGVSFATGALFVLKGAWPVSGFFGLDALLLYLAFKANYRAGRLYETMRLTRDALVVERVGPGRRRARWTFQPYWLRVRMDDPPRRDSQLVLSSHGRSLVIGAFLTPEERLEVATALLAALRSARLPDFTAARAGAAAEGA